MDRLSAISPMRLVRIVLVLSLLALAGTGCGESAPSDSAAEPRTVTVTETVAPEPEPEPVREEPSAPASEESDGAEATSASAGGGEIRVPNVVGEDHQLAQDTLQAAGLYNLAEEDASGQGRALLFDRNWTVVSQSPQPGSRVAEDTVITLRSKKDGE